MGIWGGTTIAKHYSKDGDDISTGWVLGGTWLGILSAAGLFIAAWAISDKTESDAGYIYYIGVPLVIYGGARLGTEVGDKSRR